MTGAEFREAGHQLIDTIANLIDHVGSLPVAQEREPAEIRALLPSSLPSDAGDANELLARAAQILIENSTFTGHPKFWGYICGSVAPLGILADALAAAVNPDVHTKGSGSS